MTAYQFNKNIAKISESIYEVLKKRGLIDELTKSNQNNPHFFTRNLSKLVQKELAWLIAREDYDKAWDILVEAFTNIMLHRDPFKNFRTREERKTKGGAGLEQLLHLMFQRELSALSQKYIKNVDKEVDSTRMNEKADGEGGLDDLLDYVVSEMYDEYSPEEIAEWEQLQEKILDKLKTKQNYDTLKLIMDMLLLGYSKSEIAKALGVSAVRVTHLLKPIKQAIIDIAQESDSYVLKKALKLIK